MNLSALFLETLNFGTDVQNKSSAKTTKNADTAFDTLFTATAQKQQSFQKQDRAPVKQQDYTKEYERRNVKGNDVSYEDRNMPNADATKSKVKNSDEIQRQSPNEIKNQSAENEQPEKNNLIIKEIAKKLNLTEDDVKNILEQLKISVEELSKPDNLIAFMQILLNLDSPIDLLAVSDVKEMMSAIKEIVSDFSIPMPTGEVMAKHVVEDIQKDISEGDPKDFQQGAENDTVVGAEESAQRGIKEDVSEHLTKDAQKVQVFEEQKLPVEVKNTEQGVTENTTKESHNKDGYETVEVLQIENEIDSNDGFQFQGQHQMQGEAKTDTTLDSSTSNIIDGNIKAFSEALAHTSTVRDAAVTPSRIIDQMIQKMKTDLTQNVTEIKITLKPDFLGDVTLKVASENGVVSAVFIAENQKIKETIEANFNQLKDALIDLGIEVSELSVSVGHDDNYGNRERFLQNSEKSQKRIKDIIDSLSDIEDNESYVEEAEVLETSINYRA